MWGAAKHDTAEGVHRPITATALALRQGSDAPPLLLVSLDWCLLPDRADIPAALVELAEVDASRVIVACTHTHGVGILSSARTRLPGGHLIAPYLEQARDAIADAARAALQQSTSTPCTLTWATGRCSLAANRDLRDPDPNADRFLCGFNPEGDADDTLLVGRITRDGDNHAIATIVNYACHPTTLAWDNKLLSPDYVGAMREVVEQHTDHALCLFLQGASGELAPRYQYVGDPAVADGHGRQLGYAVLSVLESMLPPRKKLVYQGIVESGAPLAVWQPQPFQPSSALDAVAFDVELPLKPLPTVGELQQQLDACADRALSERIRRKIALVAKVGSGSTARSPVWVWRVGQTLFVAQPNEPYSDFQIALRRRFSDLAVVVMNVANGSVGYLPAAERYDLNLYQVWQTPFDRAALSLLIETCINRCESLLKR
jgi:hypothetical protein